MSKISSEAKKRYMEKIKEYKKAVDIIIKKERQVKLEIQSKPESATLKRIMLAEEVLILVSYYVLMNHLSVTLLGVKNEAFLNDGRKACYKSIIYLEEAVTNYVDVPYSDYEEALQKINKISDEKRYEILRKLGLSIQAVVDGFGENSKWKWSFVELEARFATVAKNCLDLKKYMSKNDPRTEGYETRVAHMRLVIDLLQKAADRYRQKYELSTSRLDDFKLAISYLGALRRLNQILGKPNEVEDLKKRIDIWTTKMEKDSTAIEEKAKMERMKGK